MPVKLECFDRETMATELLMSVNTKCRQVQGQMPAIENVNKLYECIEHFVSAGIFKRQPRQNEEEETGTYWNLCERAAGLIAICTGLNPLQLEANEEQVEVYAYAGFKLMELEGAKKRARENGDAALTSYLRQRLGGRLLARDAHNWIVHFLADRFGCVPVEITRMDISDCKLSVGFEFAPEIVSGSMEIALAYGDRPHLFDVSTPKGPSRKTCERCVSIPVRDLMNCGAKFVGLAIDHGNGAPSTMVSVPVPIPCGLCPYVAKECQVRQNADAV